MLFSLRDINRWKPDQLTVLISVRIYASRFQIQIENDIILGSLSDEEDRWRQKYLLHRENYILMELFNDECEENWNDHAGGKFHSNIIPNLMIVAGTLLVKLRHKFILFLCRYTETFTMQSIYINESGI